MPKLRTNEQGCITYRPLIQQAGYNNSLRRSSRGNIILHLLFIEHQNLPCLIFKCCGQHSLVPRELDANHRNLYEQAVIGGLCLMQPLLLSSRGWETRACCGVACRNHPEQDWSDRG